MPIDASWLRDHPYTTVGDEQLEWKLTLTQVVDKDGKTMTRALFGQEFERGPVINDGLAAVFFQDGQLRHVGAYENGKCYCSVDLHPESRMGLFTQGRTVRTGEIYRDGTVEVLSPWSDTDGPEPTTQGYESWVRENVDAVLAAAALQSKR